MAEVKITKKPAKAEPITNRTLEVLINQMKELEKKYNELQGVIETTTFKSVRIQCKKEQVTNLQSLIVLKIQFMYFGYMMDSKFSGPNGKDGRIELSIREFDDEEFELYKEKVKELYTPAIDTDSDTDEE